MAALSLDLCNRIVSTYLGGEGTCEAIALRFNVSLGMVKSSFSSAANLVTSSPSTTGQAAKNYCREHRIAIRKLLADKPDMTLAELRDAFGLKCSLRALHYVLADMNLTFNKRRPGPPNWTGTTSASPAATEKNAREA